MSTEAAGDGDKEVRNGCNVPTSISYRCPVLSQPRPKPVVYDYEFKSKDTRDHSKG